MTREEAKNWLNKLYVRIDITDEYGDMEDMQPYEEAVNMAIKALEQEPCWDAISRVAAIDKLDEWDWQEFYLPIHFKELLDELPNVSVKEKTGWWILTSDYEYEYCTCSECGYQNEENWMIGSKIKYCQNCGAKMEVE